MSDRPEWFAATRYGFGSGMPIAWQGWAVMFAYLAVVMTAGALLGETRPLAFLAITFSATLLFCWVAARTTRGGWRWRWGNKE